MKIKIFASVLVICIALGVILGATSAYFSDTETSTGNTFTAGTLDLKIDGLDTNVVKFTQTNMYPDNQPTGSYLLKNAGTLGGYLNITGISFNNLENGILEPEAAAGDTSADVGELGSLLGLSLYFDNDKDGYFSTGDVRIYDGMINNLPASITLNKQLAAGSDVKIMAVVNWWTTPNDNLAQSDSVAVDFTFSLTQKAI